MSSLFSLVPYSSDEEELTVSKVVPSVKERRLPKPQLSRVSLVPSEHHVDEPAEHGGRARAFPHERGNWPTFVYAPCLNSEEIHKFVNDIRDSFALDGWEVCEDFHVSLSRTIALRFHWINTFTSTLQESLRDFESFELELTCVKSYCNEEASRTFLALGADHYAARQLAKITSKVDNALEELKLPKYYEDPSFHVSVLWCNGNRLREVQTISDQLEDKLELHRKNLTIVLDRVVCKCGNKVFTFPLKY